MTHAALTPLLGRAFDPFLFASLDDETDGPVLSVVSALARLDVDPWQEAASLARMPKEKAKQRLTSLLASLPQGATSGPAPEIIAARLIALLPQAGSVQTTEPATMRPVEPTQRLRFLVGLGVLALLLVGYWVWTTRNSHAPDSAQHAPAATGQPTERR
jgi:hypothetical protein